MGVRQQLDHILEERVLVLDGAMGTMIQQVPLTEKDFRGADFKDHPKDQMGNNDLLSITRPDVIREIHDSFLEAGADIISVHAENADAAAAVDHIRGKGLAAGIVLQLHTPVASVQSRLDGISMLTLLGTRMGIKGVGLDPQAENRLAEARQMIDEAGAQVLLAADGGIREHTVPGLRHAGADTIVMGSLAFGADDLAARMSWVHAQQGPS